MTVKEMKKYLSAYKDTDEVVIAEQSKFGLKHVVILEMAHQYTQGIEPNSRDIIPVIIIEKRRLCK